MVNSLVALGGANPQINTLAAYDQSQANELNARSTRMAQQQQALEWLGAAALGTMGGKLDGAPNPERWGQVVDQLAGQGVDKSIIEKMRADPGYAPVLARSSLSVMQQLAVARDEREEARAVQRMNLDFQKYEEEKAARAREAQGFSLLTPDEVSTLGLPAGSYQRGPDGRVYPVGGGAGGSTPPLGTTIYTGRDAQGNIVPMQAGQGSFVQTQLPDGVTFDPGAMNAEKAYGQQVGTGRGKAEVQAPEAIATAQRTLSQIQALKEDPGLWWSVGGLGWTPNVPGNPQAGTISRIEQIQGAAFLEAFETLKGGGQITEPEGIKATNATARLQRSQSYGEFVQALTELEEIVQTGLERAMRQGQGGTAPPRMGGAGNASVDDLLDKYR